jgi:hypothetical protein
MVDAVKNVVSWLSLYRVWGQGLYKEEVLVAEPLNLMPSQEYLSSIRHYVPKRMH